MLAFIVTGLVLGVIAWYAKHEPGDPKMGTQLIVGAAGAVVGGVVTNLLRSEDPMHVDLVGVVVALVASLVCLGVLQARVSR